MDIKARVLEHYEYLHQVPEVGFQEVKTSAYLAEHLEALGYEVRRGIAGTGVVGILKGSMPGSVVGLRADMDALGHMVNGKEVAIHSCGHDAHSAMVLTVAEALAKEGISQGAVQIIFQPAEELPVGGAGKMATEGIGSDIDMLFGIHLRPGHEAKMGELTPALHHGGSNKIVAYIEGKTAHGARPHLGINAINGAVAVIQAVNAIYSDPVIPSSIKATQIQGGGPSSNSIPECAEVAFDLRSQSNQVMWELIKKAKTAIEQGAASVGATARVEVVGGAPAAEYNRQMIELAKEAIVEEVGEKGLLEEIITPGAEDFHEFTQAYPHLKTTYLGLGCDLEPGLHDPEMHFNKAALEIGVKVLIRVVQKGLASK